MVQVYTNHIGYDCADTKSAVFRRKAEENPVSFSILREDTEEKVFEGVLQEVGEVDNWKKGYFYTLRFDELREKGTYYIEVACDNGAVARSYPFRIAPNLLETDTISAVGYFFQSMRRTGEYREADKHLKPRFGLIDGEYDLHGGWHDATGDPGVHLSHLDDTIFFNPQQVPFSVCAFFRMHDLLEQSDYPYYTQLKRRLLEEGMYGAEFVMRMRTETGGFFQTICCENALEPVLEAHKLGAHLRKVKLRYGGRAHQDLNDLRPIDYECGIRSGAGYAVAALAAAARYNFPSEFTSEEYITAAKEAMKYLVENNDYICNNGNGWNIVDFYCALDAYVEIYKTTREYGYLVRAREMAEKLMNLYVAIDDNMGYMSADETERPFFHACDAGMPVVNLLNYFEIEPEAERKAKVVDLCEKVMRYQISITEEVNNPFGYARQFVQDVEGNRKVQFFYPHNCESAGWWQGESARQGSLATAARALSYVTADEKLKAEMEKFADDQINWILGLNPYDCCLLHGRGRNNITYFYIGNRFDFFQVPGGVCNGITSGLEDEHGIEFVTEPRPDIHDNWRWAEQWIPHCSWYMYALCMKKR